MQKIKLFTAQPLCVVQELQKNGIIYPRPAYSDPEMSDEFIVSYRWLYEKMKSMDKKMNKCDGGMFWAHLTDESEHYQGYLIEMEKPLEELIISDYMMWHSPLNNSPVMLNDSEEYLYDTSRPTYLEDKIKSWDRMLEIKIVDGIVYNSDRVIALYNEDIEPSFQACFTSITLKDVVSITKINHKKE